MMMAEIWKPVPGFEGLYEVCGSGIVKSLRRKGDRTLKPCMRNGYLSVRLSKNGKANHHSIHRLVATAFLPNPDGKPEVNHIDGNKTNNDVSNLEWATTQENRKHAIREGLCTFPLNDPSHAKEVDMFTTDGVLVKTFLSAAEAERATGIHNSHISKCCNGKHKTAGGYLWKFHHETKKIGRCD